ncbi:hypothetical protein HK096_009258, partial [Nowakowskiella sp. JEL0078]
LLKRFFEIGGDFFGTTGVALTLCKFILDQNILWFNRYPELTQKDLRDLFGNTFEVEEDESIEESSENILDFSGPFIHAPSLQPMTLNEKNQKLFKNYFDFIKVVCLAALKHGTPKEALQLATLCSIECIPLGLDEIPYFVINLIKQKTFENFWAQDEFVVKLATHVITSFSKLDSRITSDLWIRLHKYTIDKLDSDDLCAYASMNIQNCVDGIREILNYITSAEPVNEDEVVKPLQKLELAIKTRESLKDILPLPSEVLEAHKSIMSKMETEKDSTKEILNEKLKEFLKSFTLD